MPTEPEIVVEESDMVVKRELHTKCVTAGRLSQELKERLGDAQFKVEMRHNVFNIESSKDFDIGILLKNCQNRMGLRRRKSPC